MRRIKKRINPVKIMFLILAVLMVINIAARYIVSEVNYSHNLEFDDLLIEIVDNSDYIQDLGDEDLQNFNYGLLQNEGQTSAWVSVYNVLNTPKLNGLVTGDEILLSSIIKSLDLYGSLFYGYAGTLPNAIKWYLNSIEYTQECEVNITYERSEFIPKLRESVAAIEFTTDFKGVEYRAIEILEGDDNFQWHAPKSNFNENLLLGVNTESYKEDMFVALITLEIKE